MPNHLLTEAEKGFAIAKLQEGWSYQRTADELHCHKTTIFYLKQKWLQHQNLRRAPGAGRPRASTAEQDVNLVQFIRQRPFSTAIQAKAETHFTASKWTARRRIRQSGVASFAAAKKTRLTEANKIRRMEWANDLNNRDQEFWENVIFSDEKVFQSSNNGKLRVYRPRGHRFNEEYIQPTDNSGRFSVHVWCWISARGTGNLHIIDGRLNAAGYVRILQDVMLPSVQERFGDNFIFQQVTIYYHQLFHSI